MHFLNDIYYSYMSLLNSSRLMDYNKNPFNSRDYILNLGFHIESIIRSFVSKKNDMIPRFENNQNYNIFKSFDLFKDNTSLEVLDSISKIITVSILILYKIRNLEYNTKEYSELYINTIKQLKFEIVKIQ